MVPASVLVVDDDVMVARDVAETLMELGYEVTGIAHSGEEAVIEAAESGADLVLMDIRMAGPMDGVDAARVLRETLNLPVVYVTAYADEHTFRRAKETEPYGYVRKPFDARDIRNAVELAMQRRASDRGHPLPRETHPEGPSDPLTLLHSRSALELKARRAIQRIRKEGGRVALAMVDLVGFSEVNEQLGRTGGDALLTQVARRLQMRCRPDDVAARLEADLFAVLLVGVDDISAARRAGGRILDAFGQPFHLNGHPRHVRARVAMAVYPDHAGDSTELVELARKTMRSIEDEQGSILHVYFSDLDGR